MSESRNIPDKDAVEVATRAEKALNTGRVKLLLEAGKKQGFDVSQLQTKLEAAAEMMGQKQSVEALQQEGWEKWEFSPSPRLSPEANAEIRNDSKRGQLEKYGIKPLDVDDYTIMERLTAINAEDVKKPGDTVTQLVRQYRVLDKKNRVVSAGEGLDTQRDYTDSVRLCQNGQLWVKCSIGDRNFEASGSPHQSGFNIEYTSSAYLPGEGWKKTQGSYRHEAMEVINATPKPASDNQSLPAVPPGMRQPTR